jgi:hypothetical protein
MPREENGWGAAENQWSSPMGLQIFLGERRVKQHVIHQIQRVVIDGAGPGSSNRSVASLANTVSVSRTLQRLLLEQHN